MDKTLKEYLDFLRKHGYMREAFYYDNIVVKIVSTHTGFTPEQVLEMPTKKVIEAIIRAKDALEKLQTQHKQYDVELRG